MLLDLHGIPLAATSRAATARAERVWEEVRSSRPDGTSFSLSLVDQGHHIWVQPVGAQGRVEAFLAVGKPEQPSQLDRIVAGHALSLFAIELAKSRAVADTERRLQGDFFDELAAGSLSDADAARGLARFGFYARRAGRGGRARGCRRRHAGARRWRITGPAPAAGSWSRVEATGWRSSCPAMRCLSWRSW